jgi:hypothetical protein
VAGPQLDHVVGDPPIEREDEPEGELGHGDRVLARAVRHVDPARRRGTNVNRVVTGAGPDDEGEVAGVEHRRGYLRRAHDEHLRPTLGEGRAEGVILERGVEHDLAAGGGETVEARLLELIGDEDLHVGCLL